MCYSCASRSSNPARGAILLFPNLTDTKLFKLTRTWKEVPDIDLQNILERLQAADPMKRDMTYSVSKQRGVYALYYVDKHTNRNMCLKVGMTISQGGLHGRLQIHFRSNLKNTVLARHMQADAAYSQWSVLGLNFGQRSDRQRFMAEYCYFKVLALPQHTKEGLKRIEAQLEAFLRPRYKDRVGGPYGNLE